MVTLWTQIRNVVEIQIITADHARPLESLGLRSALPDSTLARCLRVAAVNGDVRIPDSLITGEHHVRAPS